jgi:hypothetical protein
VAIQPDRLHPRDGAAIDYTSSADQSPWLTMGARIGLLGLRVERW